MEPLIWLAIAALVILFLGVGLIRT